MWNGRVRWGSCCIMQGMHEILIKESNKTTYLRNMVEWLSNLKVDSHEL